MVWREAKLEYGIRQIFDWVEIGKTQGGWSPKWKVARSSGGIFPSDRSVFGNRRLDLDEESGKLLLHIPKNRADLNGSRQELGRAVRAESTERKRQRD